MHMKKLFSLGMVYVLIPFCGMGVPHLNGDVLSVENGDCISLPGNVATSSVRICGDVATIYAITNNGSITLEDGSALTVTGTPGVQVGINAPNHANLTLESGSSMTIVGQGDALFPSEPNTRLTIAQRGATGTVTVANGALLTMVNARLRLSCNADFNRSYRTFGRLNVYGSVVGSLLECAAFFPISGQPPYDTENYPEVAEVNLEEGGTLAINGIQFNDRSVTTLHFNGGTLRQTFSNSAITSFFFGNNGGVLRMVIADGKNAVIDTKKNICIWRPSGNVDYQTFVTLTGTGGLVKRGEGSLLLRLADGCNTFTGPITVENGLLSLGRPLAEGQTVTVYDGGVFIPYDESENSRIVYAEGARKLFVVSTNMTEGVNLTAMEDNTADDRLGGPFDNSSYSLSGAVVHAESTLASPFRLIGCSSGMLTLDDTGLDTVPLLLQGVSCTFAFKGIRTFTAAQEGYLRMEEGMTYRQNGDFFIGDTSSVASLAVTNGTLSVPATSLYIGAKGEEGILTVADSGMVNAWRILLGGGVDLNNRADGMGTLVVSNTTVSASDSIYFSRCAATNKADLITVKNRLYLKKGAVVKSNAFSRHDDSRAQIFFHGGTIKDYVTSTTAGFLTSGDAGTLEVIAPAGENMILDISGNVGLNASSGNLLLTGEGGLIKKGVGTLRFGSSDSITADYVSDTVVEEGTLALSRRDIFPHGEGKGILRVAPNATFDLAGFPETVNAVENHGTITNSSESAGVLTLGADGRSWSDSNHYSAGVTLGKTGSGTLSIEGKLSDGLSIDEGKVVLMNAANTGLRYYRFKIEGVRGAEANSMQFSELKLLFDGVDVTRTNNMTIRYDSTYSDLGTVNMTFPAAEYPGKAVDGLLGSTAPGDASKYLDFRAMPSRSVADRDRVWIVLVYDSPVRVTHYTWATGNDRPDRDPSAWRFQGSSNGKDWVDLDVRTGFSATQSRCAWVGESFSCSYDHVSIFELSPDLLVTTVKDTVLELNGVNVTVGSLKNGGTLSLLNGSRLNIVSSTEKSLVGGQITGDGGLTFSGDGLSCLYSENTYTGDTIINSGTVQLSSLSPWKWYRITFKTTRGNGIMQLSEFSLFGMSGTRQNLGLVKEAAGTPPSELPPGSFCTPVAYSVGSVSENFEKLFDGNSATKTCRTVILMDDESDTSKWCVVTLRLPEKAEAITGYHFTTGNDTYGIRNPDSWLLESSSNGIDWVVMDSKSRVVTPGANLTEYNKGIPYLLSIDNNFNGNAVQSIPLASTVEVSSGATLNDIGGMALINSLRVDCAAGGGTITEFHPTENGTLYLTNVAGPINRDFTIPISIGRVISPENLRTWTVYINGKTYIGSLIFRDGTLELASAGLLIWIR